MAKTSSGIYIHIPFCTIKCFYCDYFSTAGYDEDRLPLFFNSLSKEIEFYKDIADNFIFDTIFIGGGTPSIINPKYIENIFNVLSINFDLSHATEITLEINPGEVALENLKTLKNIGVNRLSVGVQSFNNKILHFLTRNHKKRDIFRTIENARKSGFENINCDMIYNIPNQNQSTWKKDLTALIDLDIEHISCYSLVVERETELYQLVKSKDIKMPDNDNSCYLYKSAQEILGKKGFFQYEVTSWSKRNFECKHNYHYWNIDPCISFGPSAHGFYNGKRYWNVKNIDKYIDFISNERSPVESSERLSDKDIANELLGFGIRTIEGLNLTKIPESKKNDVYFSIQNNLKKWGNFLIYCDQQLKLTKNGFLFADAIAVDLMI